jgi:LmbE family N-acetylglucosaminyl deacetylase
MSDSGSQPRVLMIVHAHPDDESSQTGGTLARYAAAGCRTILVTCTDGSQGDAADGAKPGQRGHDPRRVAAHRSGELDAAAVALGVQVVVKLGYPDSGAPGAALGAGEGAGEGVESFSRGPVMPTVTQMVRLLRLHQPDVLITYPPNGLSGHPDHVRTHDVVVAAHANVVANGEPDSRLPRLYYIAMSASRLRAARSAVRVALGDDAWVPPEEMGTDDAAITTTIDVSAFWEQKLRALAAHASQADAAMLLRMFAADGGLTESVVRVEEYVRVHPVFAPAVVETDFFGPGSAAHRSG